MSSYLLDTNTVSHFLRGHPNVDLKMASLPLASLAISAVTEGELLYGLARRPEAKKLHNTVHEFLKAVKSLPWTSHTASIYGQFRARMEGMGKSLSDLDLLIAAHALETGRILVTNDKAFQAISPLAVEDWTA